MKIDQFLFKRAFWPFVIFLLAVLIAFWPRYFSVLDQPIDSHFHAHGVSMTLWCLLLILQPFLIRLGYKKIHRSLGYFSYLLVPLLLYSIIDLLLFRMQGAQFLQNFHLHFIALVVNSSFVFLLLYGLAIYFRKKTQIHARFMVSTVFAILTPVTDRLVYGYAQPLIKLVPTIDRVPIVPVVGFVISDLILIILIIWELISGKKPIVFGSVLLIILLMQYSILHFHEFSFWRVFCEWLVGIN